MNTRIEIDDKATIEQIEAFHLPPDYLDQLNKTFHILLEFFKENDLNYFIDGGTLLGAIREGGQIKFDDDVDLGMFKEDYDKLISLKYKLFNKHKLFLREDGYCIKILSNYCFTRIIDDDEVKKICGIDIFEFKKEEGVIMLALEENYKRFVNCYYLEEELYPLKEYTYDDLIVLGANDGVPYLERYYGDWKKQIIYLKH